MENMVVSQGGGAGAEVAVVRVVQWWTAALSSALTLFVLRVAATCGGGYHGAHYECTEGKSAEVVH